MSSIAEGKAKFATARGIVSEFNTIQMKNFFSKFSFDELTMMQKQIQNAVNGKVSNEVKRNQKIIQQAQLEIARLTGQDEDAPVEVPVAVNE